MAFDIFDAISQAQELRSSTYFAPGHYIVKLTDALVKKNRHHVDIAVIEGVVVDSTNNDITRGREVSWVCKLVGNDVGMRDLKTQFCNIVRCPADQVTGAMLKKAFSPDNETGVSPLAGTMCYVYAFPKETKAGGMWTKVEFRGMQDDDVLPDFDKIRESNHRTALLNSTLTSPSTFDENGQLIN